MDIMTILGLLVASLMILMAYIWEAGWDITAISALIQPTAAMIVFGGTIGAVMVSFPYSELKHIGKLFGMIFRERNQDPVDIINKLSALSEKARKNGLLSLEQDAQDIDNDLIKKGLALVVDGVETNMVRDILVREMELREDIYHNGAKIFGAAGGFSPTMGIIGTVMGLINVLGNLEDSSGLGHSIAVAFVATLYGVFFANVFFLAFENKIKTKAEKETMINELVIEGLLSIQAGENPRIIREKLNLALYEKMNEKRTPARENDSEAE